jgi:hypothetical protein
MMERIIRFELEGRAVLGFDTGLSAAAFAQAKMAQFISQTGYIVKPAPAGGGVDPVIETWRPQGVIEGKNPAGEGSAGPATMLVWGPAFEGEGLDRIIADDARKDWALDALRYWLRARRILSGKDELAAPFPAGALIAPSGAVLFPPERLMRRVLEADGPEAWLDRAERWVHPDLPGDEAAAFSTAAMLYRICCGTAPYGNRNTELVHEDIREGVFSPPRLMAPGLREDLAEIIASSLASDAYYTEKKIPRPGPEKLDSLLGPPGTASFPDLFRTLSDGERQKIEEERGQFEKKKALTVKTKRFIRRNTVILAVVLSALAGLGLIVYSSIRGRADLPSTEGMHPLEVIETYYGAFGSLDHTLMEACVINKAGQDDINLVTNIFVISRVREAYEMSAANMTPEEWIARGSPPTDLTVFGVSDLEPSPRDTDESDGRVSYRVSYELWLPDTYEQLPQPPRPDPAGMSPPPPALFLPRGSPVTDEVDLVLHKGAWRIAEIRRESALD